MTIPNLAETCRLVVLMAPTVPAEFSCQGTDRGVEWLQSRRGFSGFIWEPGDFFDMKW